MSKVKRQKTFFFNFTKTIRHRGVKVNVEIPDKVEGDSKTVPRDIFKKRFSNTQGLETHQLCCEKKCSDSSKSSFTITSAIEANHATKISDDILSTEQPDRSVDVATKSNPAEPTRPKKKVTRD